MNNVLKILGATCALAMLGATAPALAEEMPVVTDEPFSEAELTERTTRGQQLLAELGYLSGRADGIFGPRTARAIVEFQASQGLRQTGELDGATLSALEAAAEAMEAVKALQRRLIELGYMTGEADGIFGGRTEGGLTLFQTMNGLEPTGAADDATRAALLAGDAAPLPAGLSTGDKGDAVTALQQKLIQFGFLGGKADGKYGKATAAAVRRFQQHLIDQGVGEAVGVAATGEATPATQALLFDSDYSSYLKDIGAGDGAEVQRMERRLVNLGYMDLPADDVMDDYTLRSADAFRAAAGLGEGLDRAFVDALFSEDAPVAKRFVSHDIARGDRGLAVKAAEAAMIRGGVMIAPSGGRYNDTFQRSVVRLYDYLADRGSPDAELYADPEFMSDEAQQVLETDLLGYVQDVPGDSAYEARRVQCRLHMLYYLPSYEIDGKFGEDSAAALRAFQTANGLPATGVADRATQMVLFSDDAVCDKRPYRVEVDIENQRVYVFEMNDAGEYDQVQTFVCSTGLGDTTPRGVFLDGFPVNRWHYFTKFNCWAQYSYEIEGNIMFHSVIYDDQDADTLRVNSLYALGSPASHGCIRLAVADAKWLFEHCKRGSLVILIY